MTWKTAAVVTVALIAAAVLANSPLGVAALDSAEAALVGAQGPLVYCSSEVASAAGCSSAAVVYARQHAEIAEAHLEGRAWLSIEELRYRARPQDDSSPGVIGMTDWRAVQ